MKSPKSRKIVYRLRRYFISGLLIWVPIWITIVVIKFLIDILERTIVLLPHQYQFPGLGVILTLVIIFMTGLFAANFMGRQMISLWDTFVSYIPLVRTIHTGVKDILKMLVKPEGKSFVKVFLVEFPRKGMWTVAFQTGENTKIIKNSLKKGMLISLFIPTTPNITSGFLVIVPEDEAIELDMTMDQALKFIISLGVMRPEDEKK